MRRLLSLIFFVLCAGCVEPYFPPSDISSLQTLVVDGAVNTDGTASVRLSRSVSLAAKDYFPLERGATVTIASSSGEIFHLPEGDSAVYAASGLPTNIGDKYRLYIKTSKGDEYRSDEVSILPAPPIDKLYFTVAYGGDAIEIRVDAKDTNPDAAGFYQWDCVETYEYNAVVYAGWKLENHVPVERRQDEILYTCWRDVVPPAVIGTTNALSENVISQQVVAVVPRGSEKLSVRYSILVKQRAISREEFNFRRQLQNTTEQTGSIFSVIPGSVVSNVHTVGGKEQYILGYFRGANVSQQRLFIDISELPHSFIVPRDTKDCPISTTCPLGQQVFGCVLLEDLNDDTLITSANSNERGQIVSYNYVLHACGDCTYKGGTTKKPSFW